MTPKPTKCIGCVMFADGLGFIRDKLVGGRVTIALSTPAKEEEDRGCAGYGNAWEVIKDKYLPILGQPVDEINVTHAIRCMHRVPKRGGGYRTIAFKDEDASLLAKAALYCAGHDDPAAEGELVIAMGPAAFTKYTAELPEVTSQHDWRGHLLCPHPEDR